MGVKIREKPKGSGVWWVFIEHQGKRKSKKIGKDKKLAQMVAKKIEARLVLGDMGIIDERPYPAFSEYAQSWITTVVPVICKRSTGIDYRGILVNHILPIFGNKPVIEINRLMVKEFLLKKSKELNQSTVNRIKAVLSNVLNLAVDDGVIAMNPTYKLGKIYGKNKLNASNKIAPLTREELSLLLKTFKVYFPKHYPLALTFARTGMRAGEVYALKWIDVDFNGRFITVQRNLSKGQIDTPKSGKSRRVDMSMQLTEILWKLKRERERQYGENMPEWIFINKQGNHYSERYWRDQVLHKALDKAELRRIGVHTLRHMYASLLLQAGESMMYVKEQLGHHSIQITVDTYGHLLPGGNKEAVDRLDDVTETASIRTLSAPKTKEFI